MPTVFCVTEQEVQDLARFTWMPSRIPPQDALVAFVPDGPRDPVVDALATTRSSRWYPLAGGTRVVVRYSPEIEYDATRFHIERGAWDHEHCDVCGAHIPSMSLCWVTESGTYVLLCESCHSILPLERHTLQYGTEHKKKRAICLPGWISVGCTAIVFFLRLLGGAIHFEDARTVVGIMVLIAGLGAVSGVLGVLTSRARSAVAWAGFVINLLLAGFGIFVLMVFSR